jgi:hypothetical protein
MRFASELMPGVVRVNAKLSEAGMRLRGSCRAMDWLRLQQDLMTHPGAGNWPSSEMRDVMRDRFDLLVGNFLCDRR